MPLHEEHKKRAGRNYVLAGILLGMVALFFMVTLVKLGVF
jgi:hypothetical protein